MRHIFIALLSLGLLGCSSSPLWSDKYSQYQNARTSNPLRLPKGMDDNAEQLYPLPEAKVNSPVQKISILPPTMQESSEQEEENWSIKNLFKNVKLGRDKADMPQPGGRKSE